MVLNRLIVIGGGIVGLTTAWQAKQRWPEANIVVLEKESQVAVHQTSHNSGVVHAGVYYRPDSLKARFCRQGAEAIERFCRQHTLPWQQPGKLVVATNDVEVTRLKTLLARSTKNGLSPEWLDAEALGDVEPNVRGQAAIYIRQTAITDYVAIAHRLVTLLQQQGVKVLTGRDVDEISQHASGVAVSADGQYFHADKLICCAGAMADRLVAMSGVNPDFRIIPFRGEFFTLAESCNDLVSHLIYPVPDPSMPFLGVHLTRTIDNRLKIGPNALLALDREGYKRFDWRWRDVFSTLAFPGFWRLSKRFAKAGLEEMLHASSRRYYLQRVNRYCDQIQLTDLAKYSSGVRAQAVDKQGNILDDFHFLHDRHVLHVCNAPSPAATSAFPIADYVLERLTSN